jgi:hypothetical protein
MAPRSLLLLLFFFFFVFFSLPLFLLLLYHLPFVTTRVYNLSCVSPVSFSLTLFCFKYYRVSPRFSRSLVELFTFVSLSSVLDSFFLKFSMSFDLFPGWFIQGIFIFFLFFFVLFPPPPVSSKSYYRKSQVHYFKVWDLVFFSSSPNGRLKIPRLSNNHKFDIFQIFYPIHYTRRPESCAMLCYAQVSSAVTCCWDPKSWLVHKNKIRPIERRRARSKREEA